MKTRIANYSFNAASKTVTFSDYTAISLEAVLLIVNTTTQAIIYNFADTAKGGTAATNVLTLEFDTTSMNNADKLLIYYDDSYSTGGWLQATGSTGSTKVDIGTANTPGQVGGWYFYNPNSSVAYVQFFNAQASAVTLGTTAPVYSLGIPATSAANISAGLLGLNHATAISIAVTTTRAGSTGPGSTVDYNIFYKQ